MSVTEATIASYQASTSATSSRPRPSAWVTIAAAIGPANARRSSAAPAGANVVDQPVGLVFGGPREPSRHLAGAKRPHEGRAVAIVLDSVEAEHARADHLGGGEARVVDGERLRIAHRRQDEVVARHQPALEAGQPRHRLGRSQAGQDGVGILVEL